MAAASFQQSLRLDPPGGKERERQLYFYTFQLSILLLMQAGRHFMPVIMYTRQASNGNHFLVAIIGASSLFSPTSLDIIATPAWCPTFLFLLCWWPNQSVSRSCSQSVVSEPPPPPPGVIICPFSLLLPNSLLNQRRRQGCQTVYIHCKDLIVLIALIHSLRQLRQNVKAYQNMVMST